LNDSTLKLNTSQSVRSHSDRTRDASWYSLAELPTSRTGAHSSEPIPLKNGIRGNTARARSGPAHTANHVGLAAANHESSPLLFGSLRLRLGDYRLPRGSSRVSAPTTTFRKSDHGRASSCAWRGNMPAPNQTLFPPRNEAATTRGPCPPGSPMHQKGHLLGDTDVVGNDRVFPVRRSNEAFGASISLFVVSCRPNQILSRAFDSADSRAASGSCYNRPIGLPSLWRHQPRGSALAIARVTTHPASTREA
jgi:hypothetical protein